MTKPEPPRETPRCEHGLIPWECYHCKADLRHKPRHEVAPAPTPEPRPEYYGNCPKCGIQLGFGHLPEKCEGETPSALSAADWWGEDDDWRGKYDALWDEAEKIRIERDDLREKLSTAEEERQGAIKLAQSYLHKIRALEADAKSQKDWKRVATDAEEKLSTAERENEKLKALINYNGEHFEKWLDVGQELLNRKTKLEAAEAELARVTKIINELLEHDGGEGSRCYDASVYRVSREKLRALQERERKGE